jgi:hypothetical protein
VGRTENTVGHGADLPCSDPGSIAHGARTLARDVVEYSTEGAQACPACLKGDVGYRLVGVTKQRGCTLDTTCEQVAVRWDTKGFLERSSEVGLGDVAHLRQALHGPGLVRGGVHPIFGAQQAPQKLGILAEGIFGHLRSTESAGYRTDSHKIYKSILRGKRQKIGRYQRFRDPDRGRFGPRRPPDRTEVFPVREANRIAGTRVTGAHNRT